MSDLTAELFAPDLSTSLAALASAKTRHFEDALNDPGAGSIVFQNDDADLALVTFQSFVSFTLYGVLAFTMVCEGYDRPVLAPGEEAEQVTTWSGRGHLAILERALVYPAFGPNAFPIQDTREFGWISDFYDDTGWVTPTEVTTVATAKTSWPLPWDNAFPDDGAKVLWASDGTLTSATAGHCWFRGIFEVTPSNIFATVFLAADNGAQLYIDGVQLIDTGTDVGKTFSATLALSVGFHIAAVHCVNLPGSGDNPAGFAFAVYETDASGNLLALVGDSNATLWKMVEYSDDPPPVTVGQVVNAMLDEAEARGFMALTRTWADALDTAGVAWPVNASLVASVGADLLTVLREFSAQGHIDFSMTPGALELNLWLKGTRGQ